MVQEKNQKTEKMIGKIILFILLIMLLVILAQTSFAQQAGIGCCCQGAGLTGGSCYNEPRFRDAGFCTANCPSGSYQDIVNLDGMGVDLTPPTDCNVICGGTEGTPPTPPPIGIEGCGSPTNLIAFSGQGIKKITLQWDYPDSCAATAYEITRTCVDPPKNPDCGDPTISRTATKTYTDSDVLWDQSYTYAVSATRATGPSGPATTTANAGNLECWDKSSATPFCVSNWFYYKFFGVPYETYMELKNVVNPTDPNIFHKFPEQLGQAATQFIDAVYSSRFNGPFACNPATNRLQPIGNPCQQGACVIRQGSYSCAQETDCALATAHPFGLAYTAQSCEGSAQNPNYCVLDRSPTISDQCYACHPSMTCYDYKNREACQRNNCGTGNCVWENVPGLEAIGIGVCKDLERSNCQYCNSEGSQLADTREGYNNIFDQCTRERSIALSTPQNACFFNPNTGEAVGCEVATCGDFTTVGQCVGAGNPAEIPTQNANHEISNPSQNACNIPICNWRAQGLGGVCYKNANKWVDLNVLSPPSAQADDCQGNPNPEECAADYFMPSSSIAVVDDENGRTLQINIIDKQSRLGDELLRIEDTYKLYYCWTQTGTTCDPHQNSQAQYKGSTTGRALHLVDGFLYEGENQIFPTAFDEGAWDVYYYAEDPAKNIEVIHHQTIQVCHSCSPPVVTNFRITPGGSITIDEEEVWVTEGNPANIEITFAPQNTRFEQAVIYNTDNPTQPITATPQQIASTPSGVTYRVTQNLQEGEYLFVVAQARTMPANLYMRPWNKTFYVDHSLPRIQSITINDEELIAQPIAVVENPLRLHIEFTEPVAVSTLQYLATGVNPVTLAPEQISPTVIEAPISELSAGIYYIQLVAHDASGQYLTEARSFAVSGAHIVELINPEFGVSSQPQFNAVFSTIFESAELCKFRFWLSGNGYSTVEQAQNDFAGLQGMTRADSLSWGAAIDMASRVEDQYYTYSVVCRIGQEYWYDNFALRYDTTPPQITVSPVPLVITDDSRRGVIRVQTDDPILCKYDTTQVSYQQMRFNFPGFPSIPKEPVLTTEIIVPESQDEETYYVDCESAAQPARWHATGNARFEVNLNLPLEIITDSILGLANSTPFAFTIGTTKRADCEWGLNDPGALAINWAQISPERMQFSANVQSMRLGSNTLYFHCTTIAGTEEIRAQKDVAFDNTPPRITNVDDHSELPAPDNLQFTALTNALRIGWTAVEDQSPATQVSGGFYRLETGAGQVIVNTTQVAYSGNGQQFVVSRDQQGNALNLSNGTLYKFFVSALNNMGLRSGESSSDGVTIDLGRRPAQCVLQQCGGLCGPCPAGGVCLSDIDCLNGACINGTCSSNTCNDTIKNGGETGIDCGGSCAQQCSNGELCVDNNDCASGFCQYGMCAQPEVCVGTDLNCGSICSQKCTVGQNCLSDFDCTPGLFCDENGQCNTELTGTALCSEGNICAQG
ncbi:fibronectin type III domain-containing protein, partial [Candidatus Woesearchaeota archaeon]|nr:fibronectin type III domain-containing protein [Candidatus Woesearchaeota archaeon]